jgi:uncharacterized protein YndB with AHSA1/START domain
MSTVKVSSIIETSKQKVWEAITNPEVMKVWYFDMSNFKLEIGNVFSFYETDGRVFFHECKILNFEENKMLQHTWTHPQQSKGSSIVTWTMEELESGKVEITLTHEGVDSFADGGEKFAPANYEMGWNALVKTSLRNYLYNIQKLVFSVEINAKSDAVWNKMWNKETYTQWVTPFCEGTYFTGEMALGSRIHFIAPSFDGMYSDVFYLIPNELVIFKHIGNLKNLEEQPIDEESEKWTGCFEVYKLKEKEGKTIVSAEIDCMPEYINYMNEKFPLALQELKKISE